MADQNDYNRQLIEEFRADRSKFGGRPLLLLTTTGAKSGQRRTTPMMYVRDGDHLMVIASNVGAPTHPAWYHNLMAHPDVTVEVDHRYVQLALHLVHARRELALAEEGGLALQGRNRTRLARCGEQRHRANTADGRRTACAARCY